MTLPKNLTKRGNVFYGRVAVPKSLRSLREAARVTKNPNEITRSLGTSDRKMADRLLPEFLVAVHREFDAQERALRSAGNSELKEPTGSDLARIRRDFFLEGVRDDERERCARKSFAEVDAMREQLEARLASAKPMTDLEGLVSPGVIEYLVASDAAAWSTERRAYLGAELRKHLTESNYVLVSDVLEGMAYAKGLDIKPNSLTYKALARGLLQEWLKVLEVADRRDEGTPDDATVVAAMHASPGGEGADDGSGIVDLQGERAKRPRKDKTIRSYFEAYMQERKTQLKPSDQQGLRATLRQFIECNGDKPVAEYRRSDMAEFKKGLQQYPSNAARRYPNVPFRKVIEHNRKDGHPTLNSNTVRSKLSSLSAFGKWLESNADGVDATNFFTSPPKRDDRERMEPFSLEEVRRILNSYAFVGCESAQNYQKAGSFKLRDWHFWLTLIAAFTGARVNEIVQMNVGDLRQVDKIWVFDITDEGQGKSLKTKSSKRLVPVHPRLIELGLIGYRDELASSGKTSLFHDAKVGRNGRRSESASRWFRRFLIKIGVKGADDLGGVHRWRHTLVDALRRSDVDQYDIAAVTGHKIDISRMNGHYGREMDMSLARRLEKLSKADYPGVDFALLMPETQN